MSKKIEPLKPDEIKKRILMAIYRTSLGERLFILKGGTAIDLLHGAGFNRSSVDIDMSIEREISDKEIEEFKNDLENKLEKIMVDLGLKPFDVVILKKPDPLVLLRNQEIPSFWRGYMISVKFMDKEAYEKNKAKKQSNLMKGVRLIENEDKTNKFTIDLSAYECLPDSMVDFLELGDVTIRVYSLELIMIEKIRAICQQLSCYEPNKGRRRPRPKDFFDITNIYKRLGDNVFTDDNFKILKDCMEAKGVNLQWLDLINTEEVFEYHGKFFELELLRTIPSEKSKEVKEKGFRYYFDTVVYIIQRLKSFG